MAEKEKEDPKKKGTKGDKGEAGGEEAAAVAAAPKKPTMKFLLIGGAVLVLAGIGGAVAIFSGKHAEKKEGEQILSPAEAALIEASSKPVAESAPSTDDEELEEGEEPLGAIFPMEPLVVNLVGGSYIRLQPQIEFLGREIPRRFYARLVLVRDGMIVLLSQKRADDLTTTKGKDQLRGEMRDLVNEALHKQEAKKVYFTQFVVQ